MFSFTKESGLVKVWVSLVLSGVYAKEQVPNLFGLKECVDSVLTELQVPSTKDTSS